ncbi:hypothetical protein IM697_39875 [Streptomyces ferrugineus]|uniref:PE-PGRS family protein n=1 Tax=Streptomyces ferrugineus TaxID=1413221 RepID=A0A7M2SLM1_9ACTN|nr:hypothetical protein [Streptomyces ferrugineus]QOV36111.1 hypothetical protein IM697_39875 [Streptomyces ferrugineus]
MAENEDGALDAEESGAAPAGPFVRDFNPLTDGYPRVSPRSAVVQFYRNGGYTVKRASGVQHVDKPVLARPHSICEIALGTYVTPLQMELPAAGGTTFFKAEVDIQWAVTDPHLAALEVVTDVANRLTSPVLERLREVTTTYRVTEAEQANRAITRECAGGRWADLGSELGLRVRLYVRLRVDDRTIEHADEERDAHAQAKVIRLRQDSYRRMLQGGELEQLSFMLAADPEGAKDFLEKIRQEGRQDEKDRVARLFAMAARGELATVDVETQVLNLLNQGDGRPMVGPIGTVPARRPRELEASAGRPFNPDWASDEPPRRPPHRTQPSHDEPDRHEPHPADDPAYDARRTPSRRTEPYDPRDEADHGARRTPSRRPEPYDPRDEADHGGPGTRARRRGHRSEPYPADDLVPDDRRAPSRRPEPYDPRDEADFGGPHVPSRGRAYRPDAYPAGEFRDDESRPRPGRRAFRAEPYSAGGDSDYEDGARSPDGRRAFRAGSVSGGGDFGPEDRAGAFSAGGDPDYEDEPRSRDGRRAHRAEPYHPGDDMPRTDARRRPRRPELGSAGPVPGRDPEDESRSGDRPRTYRPEPYYPDDEWERPRRRRRGEDEGWSWAEEDR